MVSKIVISASPCYVCFLLLLFTHWQVKYSSPYKSHFYKHSRSADKKNGGSSTKYIKCLDHCPVLCNRKRSQLAWQEAPANMESSTDQPCFQLNIRYVSFIQLDRWKCHSYSHTIIGSLMAVPHPAKDLQWVLIRLETRCFGFHIK